MVEQVLKEGAETKDKEIIMCESKSEIQAIIAARCLPSGSRQS